MAKFNEVLKKRDFFLLWIGQIISQIGDRLGQMALIGFISSRYPGSTFRIAQIVFFTILPVFLIGPVAGVYVDRWDRRKTMYLADFLRGILVLLIPLCFYYSKNLIPLYFLIFIIFAIGRFFIPAKLAIIPELVKEKELPMANSLINITGMIAAILGFGVSGLLVEHVGVKYGFYLDALSFFISGLLIFLIKKDGTFSISNLKEFGRDFIVVIRKSVLEEIKEGIIYFFKEAKIRFTALVIFILGASLGALYVVFIVFVQKTLGSTTSDLGILIMFLGLGLFFGSLIYGKLGLKFSNFKVIFLSLILSGILIVVFSVGVKSFPNLRFASILSFILGVSIAPIIVASNTIVHNVSLNKMMGKVFSSLEIAIHSGFLLFMFISGILAEKIPEIFILMGVGLILVILGLVSLVNYKKLLWLE
ncbi:MAG: MFS transporter [Candidatus Omnitrophica bacterium]|nr:MFS transporter [Candidatus Omnitrophota bacterium]